jgi:hypothetical protein
MKKLIALLVFAALSVLTMAQTNNSSKLTLTTETSQAAVPATTLNGKITHNDSGFTILTVGVRPIAIKVGINRKTTFSLNGVAANFDGIKVGDSVVVEYLPLSDQAVNAISVEAHRHRRGSVSGVLEAVPPPPGYPYCPQVGSGGTIPSTATPCFCADCGGGGRGMVW